jgi:nucleoid-associated protein YgaU
MSLIFENIMTDIDKIDTLHMLKFLEWEKEGGLTWRGVDMIEIIYSKESERKDEYLRLPKNIRQIGIPDEMRKVYVEDYAITYINQFAARYEEEAKVAILVGYTIYNNSCEYIFVSGAIDAEGIRINKENIDFSEKTWTSIYDKMKKFFPGQDVVGWFLTAQGFHSESSESIIKAHIDNFAGNDKLFMKIDPFEKEEIFYVFQNSHFVRQMGYYIYYEKNEEMQEYMVQTKELIQEERPLEQVEDHATRSFRTIIQEKKEEKHQRKVITFMYSTSMLFVVIVLVIGITMMNNYDKIKNMEQTLNSISKAVNQEDDSIANDWFANGSKENGDESSKTQTDTTTEQTNNVEAAEVVNQSAIPVENVAGDVQKQENQLTPEQNTSEQVTAEQNTQAQATQEQTNQGQVTPEQTTQAPATQEQATQEQATQEQSKQETGTVTQINSTEEQLQSTLASSNQDQTTEAANTAGTAEASTDSSSQKQEYYTIEKGDTLAKISVKIYGTDEMIQKICELNHIENNNKIQAGQKLQLP